MEEINSLIEALSQYDRQSAKKYKKQSEELVGDYDDLKVEMESLIKRHRWEISEHKRQDAEFMRHFEKYFVDDWRTDNR